MKRRTAVWMLCAAIPLARMPVAPAQADITLSVSQQVYELGELVSFTLTNDSDSTLSMPAAPPWSIYDSRGAWIAPASNPIITYLYPGRSRHWSWDQIHAGYEVQVDPGRYRIELPYRRDCCPEEWYRLEAFFDIAAVPVEATTWGAIKARYQ